jgi:hypothetical protein
MYCGGPHGGEHQFVTVREYMQALLRCFLRTKSCTIFLTPFRCSFRHLYHRLYTHSVNVHTLYQNVDTFFAIT